MAYFDTPIGTVAQNVTQPQIRTNFSQANTSFGIDHYDFTVTTGNSGFHNTVTTPLIKTSAHPTTTTNPIFYAMQDSSNLGVLQYSRGPNNEVPSPMTTLQSSSSPIVLASAAKTNILDFTGITRAICMVYAINQDGGAFNLNSVAMVNWLNSSSTFKITAVAGGSLAIGNTGNILQIQNATASTINTLFWTMQMLRLQ